MTDQLITERCAASGHPELKLLFDADRVPRGDVVAIVRYLENAVARGERFAPLETIQIGWSLVRVAQESPALLVVEEPDFTSMPIRWVPGVTTTLRHLRRQQDVAGSMGVDPAFSSIQVSALVCSRIPAAPPAGATRFPADGSAPGDSGWFIGCSDPSHDHGDPGELRRESLYEVARTVPTIVPYLAMPSGWTVVFDDEVPHFLFQGEPRVELPGSFVDALRRARTP